jgi:hypothetical protein
VRRAFIVGIAILSFTGSSMFAEPPAALHPFAFLVGEWRASGSGEPGAGSGTSVFARELQDRVILRTSYAEYPAVAGKPQSRHDDLMIIYAESGGSARADYYDNEGHVIRYEVSSPAAGQAVFVSEAAGGEPTFRLSYKLEASGVLKGEFAIAPPGASDAFKPYLTWESRKVPVAAK